LSHRSSEGDRIIVIDRNGRYAEPGGGKAERGANCAIAPFTTLGVGGPAELLTAAHSDSDVQEAIELSHTDFGGVLHVLGRGSNVVVSDRGLRGLCLLMAGGGITVIGSQGETVLVRAWGGVDWDTLVAWTVTRGLSGLELLSGIPGTVGAAPMQNVSAYGQEVGHVVREVRAIDRRTAEVATIAAEDCGFGYRSSRFKTVWRERHVIASVTLGLTRDLRPRELTYADLVRHFTVHGGDPGDVRHRRAAVLHVRRRKSMVHDPEDPLSRSAGSFFVSPLLDRALGSQIATTVSGAKRASELLRWYPPDAPDLVKVPAAIILLAAGFRNGDTWGAVGLSEKHVLALVNRGSATAANVWDVAQHIRHVVRQRLGVNLEVEPQFMGSFARFDADAFAAAYPHTPGAAVTPDWVPT
jgi:UDP-N-acetylmuramate dehydrogenase